MNWRRIDGVLVLRPCSGRAARPSAADYPTRPIKLVVPYAAGGPTDVLGRLVADYLGRDLKQTVVVENKAGAQGAIGAEASRAEPDGYTLFFTAARSSCSIRCSTRSWPTIPTRDFRMLAIVTDLPVVMEVHPSVPAKTVAEFVAYARQNPGKLNFGSAGTGGAVHLAGEMFKQMAGVEMTHVPYKGAGPALADLLAGNIQVMFDTLRHGAAAGEGRIVAGARREFGGAHRRSARCADHCRERLSRLSRQRLVRRRRAGEGARRYRAKDQREPRPCA